MSLQTQAPGCTVVACSNAIERGAEPGQPTLAIDNNRSHLVTKALQECGLQLWHKGLQARPCLGNEQAQGVQNGRFYLPSKTIPNDADQWTWYNMYAYQFSCRSSSCGSI